MDDFSQNVVDRIINVIKHLPPQYRVHEGEVYKRTVWTEFVACAQQNQLGEEAFCVNIVKDVIAEALKKLRPGEIRAVMTNISPIGRDCACESIFEQIAGIAAAKRSQKPYVRVRALKDLDFLKRALSDDWKSKWDWLVLDESGRIVFEVDQKSECRKACKEILQEAMLPQVIEKAINKAQQATDFKKIVSFVKEFYRSKKFMDSKKDMAGLSEELADIDPALIFSFARKSILTNDNASEFVERVYSILTEKCPNRETPIAELLLTVVRRLLGDQDAVYPLLYGPPGTAKTFILEQLCDAFNEAGIKTNYILQAMTQNGGYSLQNNEVAMSLQGISSKWGTGRSGLIYANSFREDVDLTLVALDEVDKCGLQDYLVTLLDPRQPLQDSFWRELVPSIDMRSKVLFFATCNDVEIIRKGGKSALWSRMTPVEMDGYSHKESIDLVSNLVGNRTVAGKAASPDEIYKITAQVVNKYRHRSLPSIRSLIDQVNRQLYVKRFPSLNKVLGENQKEYCPAPGIGFGAV